MGPAKKISFLAEKKLVFLLYFALYLLYIYIKEQGFQ